MTLDAALSQLLMPATLLVLGWAAVYSHERAMDAARARRNANAERAKAAPLGSAKAAPGE
jgi:hypothetical protein